MDRIDDSLRDLFAAPAPRGLAGRLEAGWRKPALDLAPLASQFRFHATDRGVCRLEHRRGADTATARGRRHVERAREELREYLAGDRSFFSVAVDLESVPPFQARVLDEAARIPFGEVQSYAELARRIGHPRAARAVGNALGANPVPVIVPCHRIIRGDGTWGHYAFGAAMKTQLLTLERTIPALVGSASTRIVCRHGCPAEQRVAEAQRIVFASVDDARSVGYRACRVCRPA
jgi:methylated-DNA-[protein]-cysteine S-methyltransferase